MFHSGGFLQRGHNTEKHLLHAWFLWTSCSCGGGGGRGGHRVIGIAVLKMYKRSRSPRFGLCWLLSSKTIITPCFKWGSTQTSNNPPFTGPSHTNQIPEVVRDLFRLEYLGLVEAIRSTLPGRVLDPKCCTFLSERSHTSWATHHANNLHYSPITTGLEPPHPEQIK